MTFKDIPGHSDVKAVLRRMVDERRMPHALLLEGPEGIGKHMMARALAQYVHCEARTADGDSCGCCASCRQHQSWNHIDTFHVFPVVKPDNKGSDYKPVSDDFLDDFKQFADADPVLDAETWANTFAKKNPVPWIFVGESEALSRKLATTAHQADYKIVVVWQLDRLNEQASNKLLKLIEEPHGDTLFIFTSNRPLDILPTIYSRCRRVEMSRLTDAELRQWIDSQGIVNDSETAALVTSLADGSMLQARKFAQGAQEGATSRYLELFMQLMRLAYTRNVSGLKAWAEEVTDLGRENEVRFYAYCQRLIRENLVYNSGEQRLIGMSRAEEAFSSKFARFINPANAPQLVAEMERAARDIAGNGNGKIVNFDLAILTILLLKQQ